MLSRIATVSLTAGLALAGAGIVTPPARAATTYPCTWGAGRPAQLTPYGGDYWATDVLNKYSSPQAHAADVAAEWQHDLDYGIRLAPADSYDIGTLLADGSLYVHDRHDPSSFWRVVTPQLSSLGGGGGTATRQYRALSVSPTLACGAATSSASSQGVYATATLYRVDPTSSTTVAGTKVRSTGSSSVYPGGKAVYTSTSDSLSSGRGTYFLYAPAKSATLSNGDVVTIPAWSSAKVALTSGWVRRSASASLRSSKVAVPRKASAKAKRKLRALRTLTVSVTPGDPATGAVLYRRATARGAWKPVGSVRLSHGRGAVRVKRSAAARYRVIVAGYTSPVAGFRPGVDSIYDWSSAVSPAARAK